MLLRADQLWRLNTLYPSERDPLSHLKRLGGREQSLPRVRRKYLELRVLLENLCVSHWFTVFTWSGAGSLPLSCMCSSERDVRWDIYTASSKGKSLFKLASWGGRLTWMLDARTFLCIFHNMLQLNTLLWVLNQKICLFVFYPHCTRTTTWIKDCTWFGDFQAYRPEGLTFSCLNKLTFKCAWPLRTKQREVIRHVTDHCWQVRLAFFSFNLFLSFSNRCGQWPTLKTEVGVRSLLFCPGTYITFSRSVWLSLCITVYFATSLNLCHLFWETKIVKNLGWIATSPSVILSDISKFSLVPSRYDLSVCYI